MRSAAVLNLRWHLSKATSCLRRLEKELETNVALQMKDTSDADSFQVYGRGLLHLTVLIETMRREGFELMIGCPQVRRCRFTRMFGTTCAS